MDILTQQYLTPFAEESEDTQPQKANAAEFPLWWLPESKRNFDGLPDILAHLENKMATFQQVRAGFVGVATPMEKQMIERIGQMEQTVAHQGDVLQCVIQIVKAEREGHISQKIKRALLKTWNTTKRGWDWLSHHPLYALIAGVLTFWPIANFLLTKVFHK